MECAQIQITGGGSTSPATVSFPGAYKGQLFWLLFLLETLVEKVECHRH